MLFYNIRRSILILTTFSSVSALASSGEPTDLHCHETIKQPSTITENSGSESQEKVTNDIESFVSKFILDFHKSLEDFDIYLSKHQLDSLYQRMCFLFENTPASISDDLGGEAFFDKAREFAMKTMEYFNEDPIDILLTSINIAMKLYSDTIEYSLKDLGYISTNIFSGLKVPSQSTQEKSIGYFADIEEKVLISIGILEPEK